MSSSGVGSVSANLEAPGVVEKYARMYVPAAPGKVKFDTAVSTAGGGREVAKHLVDGKTEAEIADLLGVTTERVDEEIKEIRRVVGGLTGLR